MHFARLQFSAEMWPLTLRVLLGASARALSDPALPASPEARWSLLFAIFIAELPLLVLSFLKPSELTHFSIFSRNVASDIIYFSCGMIAHAFGHITG